MAKADLLSILYSKEKSPLEFKFDSMWVPSMYNFLTPQDIQELNYIATSIKYSSKIELKYQAIDRVLVNRGFKKFHCGTNRIVYSYLEDQSFLIKVALDKVGMRDNPDEYRNQFILKPFVTKTFEVSQCGTVAMVERVEPITSKMEFASIAEDIFELINTCIIGKYVLEDIGTKYFMNWGLRKGFGAVLLDYTYVYELDGNKIFCNKPEPITGHICGAPIDYDSGFNNLICTKCGKRYLAQQLETSVENKLILLKEEEGEIEMKVSLRRGRNIVSTFNSNDESETIIRREKKDLSGEMQVSISRDMNSIGDNVDLSGICNTHYEEDNTGGIQVSIRRGNSEEQQPVSTVTETLAESAKETVEYNEPMAVIDNGQDAEVAKKVIESNEPINEEVPVYSRETEVEITSNFIKSELDEEVASVDMLAALGLKDSDFEEQKTKEVKEEKKTESSMDKYYEEYGDEIESFERIKKSPKKVLDNY